MEAENEQQLLIHANIRRRSLARREATATE
jgi:hypothetical protein